MKAPRVVVIPALVALGVTLSAVSGCNKKPTVPRVAGNQPPVVRITSAPLDTTARNYYVITLNWIGSDPDGRVDRFLFAVDPPREPGADTLWEQTRENRLTRSFPCPSPDVLSDPVRPDSSADFHVFVIKAVDDLGALSPPVSRAFWSYTVAPRVEIRTPPANPLVKYFLPPAMLIRWEGEDSDGVFTQKPVRYKYKILTDALTEPVPLMTARSDPDSVRRYYAPRYWAGWDSLPGDTTEKLFTTLTPDKEYVFVVVAFDEAGAYSPIFSFNANMVYFKVSFAGALNPRIGLYNDFFLYEYEIGSPRPSPGIVIQLEVPAARPGHPEDKLTFNWYADPVRDRNLNPLGCPIRSYRWAVDIVDVSDETRRDDEENDLSHWSAKSHEVTSCRIGPYPGGARHRFYLEAEDFCGLKSLGIVEFTPVQSTLAKPLLIVNDTRYALDEINLNTNCQHPSNRPSGLWPTAAELDTFLYARGGYPWRCYPAGTMSTPGIFNGYDFDTLGTNLRTNDMTIRLATLGQYRNIIWIVDGLAAMNDDSGVELSPVTSLRYMNDDRRANTLAAYVRQGGRVWLAGGGAATASLVNFNNGGNDLQLPRPRAMTFGNTDGELVRGRFVHDQAHWRSELKQFPVAAGRLRRYLGRHASNPGVYQGLPNEIRFKSPATDPFPPNRSGQPATSFYQTQFNLEFLSAANEILEDLDPGTREDFQSTLDTLYKVTSSSLLPDTGPGATQSAVMTYYHGLDNPPFILTGFDIWRYRRSDCRDLVDFVLQRLWDLQPSSASAADARTGGAGGR